LIFGHQNLGNRGQMTFKLNMWWLVGKNFKGNNFSFKSFVIGTPFGGYVHKVMGFITWQILELLRLPWRNLRIFYHFDPTSITSHKIYYTNKNGEFFSKLSCIYVNWVACGCPMHHFGFILHQLSFFFICVNWFALNFYLWISHSPTLEFMQPFYLWKLKNMPWVYIMLQN